MKYFVYGVLSLMVVLMMLVMLMCFFTPNKDKYGNFTQPIKYWTDNVYFENNFKQEVQQETLQFNLV